MDDTERKTNSARLNRLLGYVSSLADSQNRDVEANRPIFTLIKMLSDKLVLDRVSALMTDDEESLHNKSFTFFIQPDDDAYTDYHIRHHVRKAFNENPLDVTVEIDLAKDPVLTFPWMPTRLLRALKQIGTYVNPWQEQTTNHYARLLLPMGVTIIDNGKHSTFVGMAKREGKLSIFPGSHHQAYDISGLYTLLQFDGTDYLISGTDTVAGKAASFEFGCIFEIGRMLHEKGVMFKHLNDAAE
jgi:hypothetical protein